MVQKPDIQYVTQFYSYGSEAKVLELKPARKKIKTTLPKALPDRNIRILIDPVALAGIALAIIMIILMAVSVCSYMEVCSEYQVMTEHVIELQNTNIGRQQAYEAMFDLADVQEKALALGMVPLDEAKLHTIDPVIPQPEAQETVWENISWFLKGLFA